MVSTYADLVELGLRTVDPVKSKEKGIILVPDYYREKVIAELKKRGTFEGALS